MKYEKRINRIILGFFAAALAAIVVLCFVAEHNYHDLYSRPLSTASEQPLDQGWELVSPSGAVSENLSMPMELDYSRSGDYVLRLKLPAFKDKTSHPALLFATNHMDITARVDGQEIYSYNTAGRGLSKSPGNIYHIFVLPMDCAGLTLEIQLTLLLGDSIPYTVVTPVLASRAALITDMVKSSLPSLTLLNLIIFFGILLLIMAFVFRRADSQWQTLMYTGLFALLFAGYVLSESEIIHLLIPNTYVVYLCDFLSLSLLSVPILLLLTLFVPRKLKPALYIVTALSLISFAAEIVLNFSGILDLREFLPVTHGMIIVSIIMVVLSLYMKTDSANAVRKNFSRALLPVLLGTVIDLVLFYTPGLQSLSENSMFFQLGVFLFVIVQMKYAIKAYLDFHIQNVQVRVYEKMAYTDALTGIGNRAAFEQELAQLDSEKAQPLWCTCADLNNLKVTNDTMGHSAGDTIIREAAHILSDCTGGNVYRTGGDEFVFFCRNTSEKEMEGLMKKIHSLTDRYNRKNEVFLSFAMGCDCLRPEDRNVLDLYIRADRNMYEEKVLMKKQLPPE